MKPAPHGRHAIPRGTNGGPNDNAKRGTNRGGIVAKKSAAPRLRKPSSTLAGDVLAYMYRAAHDSLSGHLFEDFSHTGTIVPYMQPGHVWSGTPPTR